MQCHAFVLHLIRAEKRQTNAKDLLETCGLAGQIWPAVDGAAMSSTDLSSTVGAQLFDPPYPFALKTGEIGCFLSHRQIWAEMQARDIKAALIIEDDASLDTDVLDSALDLAQAHIQKLGYIQFQTRAHKGPSTLIDTSGPCALVVPQNTGLRTTVQMISKDAAARLLSLSETFDRPVDTFIQSHWHTGLRAAEIYPSGIRDIADSLDGSTIQGGKKPFWEKLWRKVARTRYRSAASRLSQQSSASQKGGLANA